MSTEGAAAPPPEAASPVKEKEVTRSPERQKTELGIVARATLKNEARRQLTDENGEKKTAQTPQEIALRTYQLIADFDGKLEDRDEDNNITFDNKGNQVPLGEIEGTDPKGESFTYKQGESSVRQIVGVDAEGKLICTIYRNGRPDTRTVGVKDPKTGLTTLTQSDVLVHLDREDVLDAQFLSEQAVLQGAVGPDKTPVLEAHANALQHAGGDIELPDDIDVLISESAAANSLITKEDLLNSTGINDRQKALLEEQLSGIDVLTPQGLRDIPALLGWDQLGVRRRNDEIDVRLSQLEGRTGEVVEAEVKELTKEKKLLEQVSKAVQADENGNTEVSNILEQIQNGGIDAEVSQAVKDAVRTGETAPIFKALNLPEDLDENSKARLKKVAKIAGGGTIGAALLLLLLTGGAMSVAAKGMAEPRR